MRNAYSPNAVKKPSAFGWPGATTHLVDAVNRKLLTLLRLDSRTKYAELGKAINLSAPAVFDRVAKLVQNGVIRRFTAELDPAGLGLTFCAFVRISMDGRTSCRELALCLEAYPEIEECHSIAGEDCILVKVRTANPASLDDLLQKVRAIPYVDRTVTTVVLLTHFERGVQPENTG